MNSSFINIYEIFFSNFMDRKNDYKGSFWYGQVIIHFEVVIYRCKNLWKTNLKMTIQLLKLYLELTIYWCKNDEHTPKTVIFIEKTMKTYSEAVILSI